MLGHVGRELIIGIDPGSLRTGFGVIERVEDSVFHVAHGTIVLGSGRNISERLRDLSHDLSHLITKHRPVRAVVEDVFVFKNPRAALTLGQARGAVLAILGLHDIATETLAPTAVKSLISGHGKAKKFQVAQLVAIELNIPVPESPDAADALALALSYARLKHGGRMDCF